MSPIGVGTSRSTQAKQTNTPKLWLLLVGVNQYQDEQIPSLRYSAVDCQGLAEALINASSGQFSQKEVKIYHDFAPQLPLLETVSGSLKEITTAAKSIDTVLFYFSGHGIIQSNTQQAYLCLADTQKSNLENTGLALQDLLQSLNHCASQNQLVWLDACHSGGMTLRGTIVESLPSPTPQLVQVLQQRAAISKGFYALLSCDTNQQSWEFTELGHGVFTYYLIRGLRGDAADKSSVISADSLYRYVYHQTLQYIDKTNQQLRLINQQKHSKGETQLIREYSLQTPKRIVEGVGELILGRKLDRTGSLLHRRVGLVVEGLSASKTTLDISKFLGSAGGFELEYLPAIKATALEVRTAITRYLDSPDLDTILLYLRGQIEDTEAWEGLILGEIRIKRSWLKQQLRRSNAKQIIILDCFVEKYGERVKGNGEGEEIKDVPFIPVQEEKLSLPGLQDWVEDLQIDSPQGQCIISCISTTSQPERFTQTLLDILTNASQSNGLSAAYAIAQLQFALAGSNIPFHVSLSGSQGIIEILPPQVDLPGLEQTQGLDLHVCPYMGLNAFSEDDAQYYYGRESLTQEIINSLQNNSFLAVVGASGSGKSSVVQAGVIPQLRLGKQIPNSEQWLVKTIRPGANPIDTLAQKLGVGRHGGQGGQGGQGSNISPSSPPSLLLEGILHQGVEGFVYWLRSQPHPMIVLVVDQFEELFTLACDVDREKFLDLLLGAVKYASDRFKLIITLRADFIAPCLEVPALAQALQQSSVLVSPRLSLDDYRQVITKPAYQVGLKVEPELVEVLLHELDNSVGNLPLLEFVLEQLWQHRVNGELTLQAYQQQLGGIQGALERSSQTLYESLEPRLQDCTKWIFLALTQLGEGTEDTRRRVLKSELIVKKYPQELVDRTLQALTNAKLVVVNLEETEIVKEAISKGIEENQGVMNHKGHEGHEGKNKNLLIPSTPLLPTPYSLLPTPITVEVAHEILIRHWSTLRWWLEENRERLRKMRQIEQATQNWLLSYEQADFLLQGVRLAEAEDIYIKYTDELSTDVQRYIEACLAERKRLQFQEKKRLRQAQRAVVGLSILGIAACSFGGLAYWQGREARFREIEALNSSSKANLLSNQQLEALIVAVKAGKELQNTLAVPVDIRKKTTNTIQQAFSNTQELNRLEGHNAIASSVSFSSDGKIIASGSDDNTVKVWRNDGSLLWTLQGHTASVKAVRFSPDGKILASASFDQTVKLWNTQNGKLIKTLSGHQAQILSVAFSRNGKLLAASTADGNVTLWQLSNNSLLKTLKGHPNNVTTVTFTPDNQIITASTDGRIKFWQVDGKLLRDIPAHTSTVYRVAVSQDGKILASASGDRTVKLWRIADGSLVKSINAHSAEVRSVNFSPDGQTLASTSTDSTIKLWSSNDGELLETLQGHSIGVYDVSFSPNSQTLVSASEDKTIRIWQRNNNLWKTLIGHQGEVYTIAFNPKGNLLASGGKDRKIRLWNIPNGSIHQTFAEYSNKYQLGHRDSIFGLAFSPDGETLASAGKETWVKLWRVHDGDMMKTLLENEREVNNVNFSPVSVASPKGIGETLVSGGADGKIRLWNLKNRTLIKVLATQSEEILAVRFNLDGKMIASAGRDNTIKFWQVSTGKLLHTLKGHTNAVNGIAFTPNGKIIASASSDKTIKLWQVDDGKLINTLEGHTDAVWSINFNADGTLIASGSSDKTVKIWNIQGKELNTFRGHSDAILNVSFTPDTKLLASGSFDSTIKLWRLDSTKLRTLDLDSLLVRSCDRLHNYLQTNPKISAQERRLCSR
jgi:WD40 repeat protein/uncharacterized caspase-like protein